MNQADERCYQTVRNQMKMVTKLREKNLRINMECYRLKKRIKELEDELMDSHMIFVSTETVKEDF